MKYSLMAKRFYCQVSAIVFFIALLHVLLPIYILLHFSQTVLTQTRNSHRFDNSPVNTAKCVYTLLFCKEKNMRRLEGLSGKKVMRPRGHSVIAVICIISSHNPSDFPGCFSVMILAHSGNNMGLEICKIAKHLEEIEELCVALSF